MKLCLRLALAVLLLLVLFIVVPSVLAGTADTVVITARPLVAPEVTNGVGATNVVYNGARLNGEVTDTGNENPTTHVYWGTTDGGFNPAAWDDSVSLGVLPLGAFYYDATLLPSTTYFYTTYVVNSAGDDWALSSENFTTPATSSVLLPPTGFTITDLGGNTVNITWTMGTGATSTLVRVVRNDFPTIPTTTIGEEVYSGNGTTCLYTGLNLDTVEYTFYAWSENITSFSVDYTSGRIGGGSMIFLGLLVFAGILSFISARSSYWILKFLAGCVWGVVGMYWISSPQGGVQHGSSVDTGIIILFFFIGFAFMLMTFWNTKTQNGQESGRFRLPFMATEEEEELAERQRKLPTRQQRTDAYKERLNKANRGERR